MAPLPSYWSHGDHDGVQFVDISPSALQSVQDAAPAAQEMFNRTKMQVWTRDRDLRAGEGKNVPAGYTVLSVERIENPRRWRAYVTRRAALARADCPCAVKTAGSAPEASCSLEASAGECFLFHSTAEAAARSIATAGFDTAKARDGLFGRVICFAESCTKADEYSGGGALRVLLICRVARGRTLRTADREPNKAALAQALQNGGFDSIHGDRSCTSGFQEFALGDPSQAYAEYLVKYRRSS